MPPLSTLCSIESRHLKEDNASSTSSFDHEAALTRDCARSEPDYLGSTAFGVEAASIVRSVIPQTDLSLLSVKEVVLESR